MKTLHDLGAGLFERNDPAKVLGMEMGHRMTVATLAEESGGGLWIHSPVAWSQELWNELEALAPNGAPKHLIIPSRTHDLHLSEWLKRIPASSTYAPAALQRAHPKWDIGQTLTEDLQAPWSSEIEHTRLEGAPRVSEVICFHKPSKTLILVDCVFNLQGKAGFIGSLLLKLNQCQQGISTSRIFKMTIADRCAFRESLRRVLTWDFERAIVGHGELIGGDAVTKLRSHFLDW